ncbi:MAG: DMT family transporter [Desulfovermiculus sp.]|nr:DMT family transporter [Desulfovermiculus sp.]
MPAKRHLQGDCLLLLTAMIWGSAFVAQKVGMEHIGPFVFNGVRFGLGALALTPLALRTRGPQSFLQDKPPAPSLFISGVLAGLLLFAGSSLQQVGIIYTTAGKAGFITGLYVIIVPLLGLFWGQKAGRLTWLGACLAVLGLYLLTVKTGFTVSPGDGLVFLCAVMFALHVLTIGWLAPRLEVIKLAVLQFWVCSFLSLGVGLITEHTAWSDLIGASVPILYGGLLSVGVAYTLQVVAQRKAPPTHAAIILSLETVFAVFSGCLILGETLTPRAWLGCGLMLCGMLAAQLETPAQT